MLKQIFILSFIISMTGIQISFACNYLPRFYGGGNLCKSFVANELKSYFSYY